MNVHGAPGGQAPPQVGASLPRHGVLPLGIHPQSTPPVTHTSPDGHTPSHSGEWVSPQGVAPAMHWHSPLTSAHTGSSGGQSP